MPRRPSSPWRAAELEPRRRPRQARSRDLHSALLEATRRVLVRDGARRLSTTRVAVVAGVSVGSLYQYFPNRAALLRGLLERHLDVIASSVIAAAHEVVTTRAEEGVAAIVGAFIDAKNREHALSLALRPVLPSIEGEVVVRAATKKVVETLAPLVLEWSSPGVTPEASRLRAFVLASALEGVVSLALEVEPALLEEQAFRLELQHLVRRALGSNANDSTVIAP
jgi:AcrR family transcriptional regulator